MIERDVVVVAKGSTTEEVIPFPRCDCYENGVRGEFKGQGFGIDGGGGTKDGIS